MTPRLTLDADALARMRPRYVSEARSLRPRTYRPDGLGVTVTLPGSDYLAALLTLDVLDAYRSGRTIVARPHGSEEEPERLDPGALADGLRETLRDLPHRTDAREPYTDLRRAASVSSAMLDAYLLDVVRSYRERLPAAPRPEARHRPDGPKRTRAEIERDRRATIRVEEERTAEYVLRLWQESGALAPGTYSAPALFEKARSDAEDALRAGRTLPDGAPLADEIGPRNFYRVADRLLGPRTRTKHGHRYTFEGDRIAPMFTRSEILAEVARQERDATASADAEALAFHVEGFLAEVATSRLDG